MKPTMNSALATGTLLAAWLGATPVLAHHSYAMFDASRTLTVSGTVAKHDWRNPHSYIWVYVPKAAAPAEFDLYTFENGSPGMMTRLGWTRTSLNAGDKITVEYLPLKDGRNGGHFMQATFVDGRILKGDPALPIVVGKGVASPVEPATPKP